MGQTSMRELTVAEVNEVTGGGGKGGGKGTGEGDAISVGAASGFALGGAIGGEIAADAGLVGVGAVAWPVALGLAGALGLGFLAKWGYHHFFGS
jgi:hypothetical protein